MRQLESKHSKPQPPPFCCDCAHFIPEKDDTKFKDIARCSLSEMVEVVRGSKFFPPCIEMRGNGAPCGMEAKYFKPKDDLDKPAQPMVEPDKTNLN